MIQWSILIGIYYRTGDYRLYLYTLGIVWSFSNWLLLLFCFCSPSIMCVARSMWNCTHWMCSNTQILFVWNFLCIDLIELNATHTTLTASGDINDVEIVVSSLAVHIQQCKHHVPARSVWDRKNFPIQRGENKETDNQTDATLTYY